MFNLSYNQNEVSLFYQIDKNIEKQQYPVWKGCGKTLVLLHDTVYL